MTARLDARTDAFSFPGSDAGTRSFVALAVDTLKQGLLLLDRDGCVLAANAAAQRTVHRHPAMDWVVSPFAHGGRRRLQIRRSAPQMRLERTLRRFADAASGEASVAPRARMAARSESEMQIIAIPDEHGHPSLILTLSPVAGGRSPDAGPVPIALGTLIDRATEPVLERGMLRDLFGLTEAESRVAEAYLRADTVKEVGELLGVSANTVKTHLAAVYLKTGCTRQAQLVRLLMSLSGLGDEPAPTAAAAR